MQDTLSEQISGTMKAIQDTWKAGYEEGIKEGRRQVWDQVNKILTDNKNQEGN